MTTEIPRLYTRLASSDDDLLAAQRLRYEVFVSELGSDGVDVDHGEKLERDRFDPFFDHLLLIDRDAPASVKGGVVGVYRLLRHDQVDDVGQYYSEAEYDLTPLKTSGRKLLELGRSCLLPEYRGGTGMYLMWNALAEYVQAHDIEILFGVASFHGTDPEALSGPLSLLYHRHLAPDDLRVRAVENAYQSMNLVQKEDLDAKAAMLATPALIKAYLRLGGYVGDGAYIDHEFNTIDVCLILDTTRMNSRQRSIYAKGGRV